MHVRKLLWFLDSVNAFRLLGLLVVGCPPFSCCAVPRAPVPAVPCRVLMMSSCSVPRAPRVSVRWHRMARPRVVDRSMCAAAELARQTCHCQTERATMIKLGLAANDVAVLSANQANQLSGMSGSARWQIGTSADVAERLEHWNRWGRHESRTV